MTIRDNKYYKLNYNTYEIELEIIRLLENIDYYEDFRLRLEEVERKEAYGKYVEGLELIDEAMRYYAYVSD